MAIPSKNLPAAFVALSLSVQACGQVSDRPENDGVSGSAGSVGGSNESGGASGTSGGTGASSGGGNVGGTTAGGSSGAGNTGGSAPFGGSSGASSSGASSGGSGGASAGAGGSSSGASGAPSTGGSSGASGASGFSLLWRDEFETFDTTRWGVANHTFTENLAEFRPENVVVEAGVLKLRVTPAPSGSAKPYLGGEARTHAEFTYGRFETRARFARGSGLVASLFTFYDHLPMNWNEIDIEFLGRYADRIQYNTILWDSAQARQTDEHIDVLSFDPAADFHVYAIEWVPDEVRFLVDGELRHTATDGISQYMKLPQKVMVNLWPANIPDWVGPIDAAAIPAESQYDWVAVYAFNR